MDKFHQEDYGPSSDTKPRGPKMLDRKMIEQLRDSFQSRAVKAVIERILGAEVPDVQTRDDFTAVMESKEMLVDQYLPRLKPEIAAIVRLCLVNPNPVDFQQFLEANCVSEEVQPEVQSTEVAEAANEVTEFSLSEAAEHIAE
jgi:hypothetical protein